MRFTGDGGRWMLGGIGAGAVGVLLTLEVVSRKHGISALGLLLEVFELGLTLAAAVAISLLFARMQRQHEEKIALLKDLEAAHVDGAGLRRQIEAHVDGLGAAIERQFDAWSFTSAERAVALLMLKGYSHKEIAASRGTSEATVRQQATSAYQRSGLGGRAALCAFFLEDLLAPTSNAAAVVEYNTCSSARRAATRGNPSSASHRE